MAEVGAPAPAGADASGGVNDHVLAAVDGEPEPEPEEGSPAAQPRAAITTLSVEVLGLLEQVTLDQATPAPADALPRLCAAASSLPEDGQRSVAEWLRSRMAATAGGEDGAELACSPIVAHKSLLAMQLLIENCGSFARSVPAAVRADVLQLEAFDAAPDPVVRFFPPLFLCISAG
eukprot:SAG25_NODE_4556_length_791_cov_0.819364_1_plen_175_part_10